MGPVRAFYSLLELLFIEAQWPWTRRGGTTQAVAVQGKARRSWHTELMTRLKRLGARPPNTLETAQPGVPVALGNAIADLNAAKVPLDARVRDVQRIVRARRRIAIHGGPGDPHGEFNAIESGFVPGNGFAEVAGGSSYVQVVTWNDGPCPDAATILTYSQSANPRSPFFADQGPLFSHKQWVPVRFCRRDVLRHTLSTTVLRATH